MVAVPVPDMALIRPGHQLKGTVAVPVDGGHVHPMPPEFQWLAIFVEQEHDGLGEHRLTIGSDIPGEQDIAAAIRAAMLWADTDQQIEETIVVPVDHVELGAPAAVTAGWRVDTVGLDRRTVLIAQLLTWLQG